MVHSDENYIYSISKPYGDLENTIHEICKNPPKTEKGYGCRLKTDLTWEIFEFPKSQEEAE